MISLLRTYFSPVFHPYKAYGNDGKLDFSEAISISWIFAFIRGLFTLAHIYLGYWTFDFFQIDTLQDFEFPIKFQGHRFLVLLTVLEIILFPLALWLVASFWKGVINFFGELFSDDETIKDKSEEIVTMSMSAHFFYVIPFFGEFLQQLFTVIYIYVGLKERVGLSRIQALFIVVSPILVFGGAFAMLLLVLSLFLSSY